VKINHLMRRLLSSNIGKLNRVADRQPGGMPGSAGKTVIPHSGDFFAIRLAPVTVAPSWRAGGAS